jgi:hypothetical protein
MILVITAPKVKSRFRVGIESPPRYALRVADVKIPTTRQTITLPIVTVRRLEILAKDGWFGSDVAGVAASLVEAGIRRARRDNYLPDDKLAEAKALTAKPANRRRPA